MKKPTKPRTLSEILIDADKAKDINELSDLWDEIVRNKYSYPIVELNFAREHIQSLLKGMKTKMESLIKLIINELKD